MPINGITKGVHYLNVFWYGSNKFLVRIIASVSVNATIIISDTAIPEEEKTYSGHARRVASFFATVFACSRITHLNVIMVLTELKRLCYYK